MKGRRDQGVDGFSFVLLVLAAGIVVAGFSVLSCPGCRQPREEPLPSVPPGGEAVDGEGRVMVLVFTQPG